MIINGTEIFREQAGLIPSLDTGSTSTSDCILLNFDSAKNTENAGGYVRLRLEDGFLYFECINVHGDIFAEQVIHCSSFNTLGDEEIDLTQWEVELDVYNHNQRGQQ